MKQSDKKITKENLKNQSSKLKSKKAQLENLLRKQTRLKSEIDILKKSILKDHKRFQRLTENLRTYNETNNLDVIQEEYQVDTWEDPEDIPKDILSFLLEMEDQFNQTFNLLLKFADEIK